MADEGRLTAQAAEVLAADSGDSRLTAQAAEVLAADSGDSRLTAQVAEVLAADSGAARLTAHFVEVICASSVDSRLTAQFTEVISASLSDSRLTSQFTEVLSPYVAPPVFEGLEFASDQEKTARSVWDSATTNREVAAGQWGMMVLVTDNEDSVSGVSTLHVSVNIGGSSLLKAREYSASQGSPNSGSTVSVWYFQAAGTIASGSVITVTLNTGRTAKAILGHVFDLDSEFIISEVDGVADEIITASTPGGLSATGVNDAWHIWVRGIGSEYPTDTLGGLTETTLWLGMTENGSTGNPDDSNQSARAEYLIKFGTESGNTAPSGLVSADDASILVGLSMAPGGGGGGGAIHVAQIGVFNIDAVGNILKKDDNVVTIRQHLNTSISHRIIIDPAIPNSAGNPTVKTYLELEAADDYVMESLTQSTIITYVKTV